MDLKERELAEKARVVVTRRNSVGHLGVITLANEAPQCRGLGIRFRDHGMNQGDCARHWC